MLIHGAIDSSSTWERLGALLGSRGRNVLAVDLHGHGASLYDPARHDHSLKRLAADVTDTITQGGLGNPDVVIGHSLGALVALAYAVQCASPAPRLVLEDPPGPGIPFAMLARDAVQRIESARNDPTGVAAAAVASMPDGARADEVRTKVHAIAAAAPEVAAAALAKLADTDILALAEQCAAPALLLVGRDKGSSLTDPSRQFARYSALSGEDREQLLGAFTAGTLVTFDAGHDIHQTVFEDYVREVLNWLDLTSPCH